MTALEIVELVLAVLGGVNAALTGVGAVLPADSAVGKFCRTAATDVKAVLGLAPVVEAVVSAEEKK